LKKWTFWSTMCYNYYQQPGFRPLQEWYLFMEPAPVHLARS
jgi:hypothetical protein